MRRGARPGAGLPSRRTRSGVLRQTLQQAELHRERHELLLGAIVEVALDLATLLVLGLDQPAARRPELIDTLLQLRGKPGVAEDEAGLRREIFHELVLGGRKRLVPRFDQRQRAEQFRAVPDGDRARHVERGQRIIRSERDRIEARRVGRPRGDRAEFASHAQPHVDPRGAGPASEDRRHPLQDVVQRVRAGHPLREVGEHLIRRRSIAVDQPVRQALCASRSGWKSSAIATAATIVSVELPLLPTSAPTPTTTPT